MSASRGKFAASHCGPHLNPAARVVSLAYGLCIPYVRFCFTSEKLDRSAGVLPSNRSGSPLVAGQTNRNDGTSSERISRNIAAGTLFGPGPSGANGWVAAYPLFEISGLRIGSADGRVDGNRP